MPGADEILLTVVCRYFHSHLQLPQLLKKQMGDRKGRRGIGRTQAFASIASGNNPRRRRLSMDRSKIGCRDQDLRFEAADQASCSYHIFFAAPRVREAPELESDRLSRRYQNHAKLERFDQPQRYQAR